MQTTANPQNKQTALPRVLFFFSGAALTVLYGSTGLVGGGEATKYIAIAARTLVAWGIFFYASFVSPLPDRVRAEKRTVLVRVLFGAAAIAAAYALSMRFYNTFFREIIGGGQSPVIVYRLWERLPLPGGARTFLARFLCIAAGLLACYACDCLLLHVFDAARRIVRGLRTPDAAAPAQEAPAPAGWKRYGIAAAMGLLTAALGWFTLDVGQDWGADYALYMQQAFDLSNGNFAAMVAAWGYSAMMVPIYRIFGWNMTTFDTLIYYKLPGLLCLALLVALLYLCYSKRFSARLSVFLTALVGLHPTMLGFANRIFTDVPHLFLAMACLAAMDLLYASKTPMRQVAAACLVGALMWAANLVRAAAIALPAALFIVQALCFTDRIRKKDGVFPTLSASASKINPVVQLLPYAVYGALSLLTYAIIPYTATHGSLLSYNSASFFFPNIKYYWSLLSGYFRAVGTVGYLAGLLSLLTLPLLLLGIWKGARKEPFPAVYFVIYLPGLLFNWALNGIRYAFPLIPILLLFLGYGIRSVDRAVETCGETPRLCKRCAAAVALLIMAGLFGNAAVTAGENMAQDRAYDRLSFSAEAIDTYHYIQENTAEDAAFVFFKPAVLELATGRTTLREMKRSDSARYLLITMDGGYSQEIPDQYPDKAACEAAYGVALHPVYENDRFVLYEIER